VAAGVFGVACQGQPAEPATDAGFRFGCPVLSAPQAMPGDDIGGDTYASFATGFFEAYCIRCHSVDNTTREERSNAPPGLNWDDETSVRENLDLIRNAVGVVNFMPPSQPAPDCDERQRLIRWIDSGAP
jgi:uncharacterized membrane protein